MSIAYDRGLAADMGLGAKLLRFNWVLAALLAAAASVGFIMLYSVAGGDLDPWARLQIVRFAVGFGLMLLVALIDVRIWRAAAGPLYLISVGLLVVVEFFGQTGMGAQRWLAIGPILLQPSEIMKISLVLALARYYDEIGPERASSLLWIAPPLILALIPTLLVIKQPDLGTALLLMAGALAVMYLAGVTWWFFGLGAALASGAVAAVFLSRGTDWQVLKDYQYSRITTFLDPTTDPLGAGYHINQSLTAIGSGGVSGKGLLGGTQTHLSFLPEPHTDFIFTTLAEEFGLLGGAGLLGLYMAIICIATISALRIRSLFGRLLAAGVAMTFFFFFAINMAMVMGLAPVVGVPLPLVSYGGTSMLALLFAFGLSMSAEIHDDRR
ncbi:MAG: rod shape-determining protein RodA [Rhodobacteraceae bacterium]|nr:rod shape-determining protein RodA [Paracoccaceae bacterium]